MGEHDDLWTVDFNRVTAPDGIDCLDAHSYTDSNALARRVAAALNERDVLRRRLTDLEAAVRRVANGPSRGEEADRALEALFNLLDVPAADTATEDQVRRAHGALCALRYGIGLSPELKDEALAQVRAVMPPNPRADVPAADPASEEETP